MKTNSMMSIDDALDAKFNELVVSCMKSGAIDLNLYQEYDVKRGLRDSNGKGVLTGLTEISDVTGYRVVDGVKEPADGMLYYQGYDVKNLVGDGIDKRFAFEETTYCSVICLIKSNWKFSMGSLRACKNCPDNLCVMLL